MIEFKKARCPKCGRIKELVFSNNPILSSAAGATVCFDCINETLNYQNLEHADFFCRTFNLPFKPELWLSVAEVEGPNVFKFYTSAIVEDPAYNHANLYYTSSTHDLWSKANREWERCRSFAQLLRRLEPIKESYIERGYLKWGEQYTFEELIKLDSIYSKTLKSNSITNPMQKEAVKTLCKLQIEMDEAIRAKDAKAIKDFSSAWSTFAKQADLENMINESKTDDITTVAELYQYCEDQGWRFKYFDGVDKDEVDRAITDIQNANKRLILESTGLQQQLEEMLRQRTQNQEEEYTKNIVDNEQLKKILEMNSADLDSDIETEDDDEALNISFDNNDTLITTNDAATNRSDQEE